MSDLKKFYLFLGFILIVLSIRFIYVFRIKQHKKFFSSESFDSSFGQMISILLTLVGGVFACLGIFLSPPRPPEIFPKNLNSNQNVIIYIDSPDKTLTYYTFDDNSIPNRDSNYYTQPITIKKSSTIIAVSIDSFNCVSDPSVGIYTIESNSIAGSPTPVSTISNGMQTVIYSLTPDSTLTPTPTPRPLSLRESLANSIMPIAQSTILNEGLFDLYSGPGSSYIRGANGKASVDTKNEVMLLGAKNGWTLIAYEVTAGTDIGNWRTGFINGNFDNRSIPNASISAICSSNTYLTDDPTVSHKPLVNLPIGMQVTVMAIDSSWAYVQYPQGPAWGYVPLDALE